MSPKQEGQYALRANISQEAIANVRKIQGAFAAAGTNYTIEQVINYILLKAKK